MPTDSIAFLSYARDDDKEMERSITRFRERVEAEVRVQGVPHFRFFQDITGVGAGDAWRRRIDDALSRSAVFVPIITPRFFRSKECMEELRRFFLLEEAHRAGERVIPVYFVECQEFQEPLDQVKLPELRRLRERQYVDWCSHRFDLWSATIGREVARLAERIRARLPKGPTPDQLPSESPPPAETPASPGPLPATAKPIEWVPLGASSPPVGAPPESTLSPDANPGPRPAALAPARANEPALAPRDVEVPSGVRATTVGALRWRALFIVDASGRGDFTSLAKAIANAPPGSHVLVRPGVYRESLVVSNPIEILGQGPRDHIIVEHDERDVLVLRAPFGRLAGLTIRQRGTGEFYAIEIEGGRFEVENCVVTSTALACVAIHRGASPRLSGCLIENGANGGIVVYETSSGAIEDCEIAGTQGFGILVTDESSPSVRRTRVDCPNGPALMLRRKATGRYEGNELRGSEPAAVDLSQGALPILRHNRVNDVPHHAVIVRDGAGGTLMENDIRRAGKCGVVATDSVGLILRDCDIQGCGRAGIFARGKAELLIECSRIIENGLHGVEAAGSVRLVIRSSGVQKNSGNGLFAHGGAMVESVANVFDESERDGLRSEGSDTVIHTVDDRYKLNGEDGIYLTEGGRVIAEGAQIVGNQAYGVRLRDGALDATGLLVASNARGGIQVGAASSCTVLGSDVQGNGRDWVIAPEAEERVIRT